MSSEPEKSTDPRRHDYKLWLWVAGAFVVIIIAWTFLIWLAGSHTPQTIPLEKP